MRLIGTALILALALAGCATTTSSAPAASAGLGRGLPLESGKFVAETLGGGDYPKVTIEFSPGDHDTSRVSGMAGCNRFNGGYTQTPTTMTFKPLASTMMMCPDAQMETERKLFTALDGTVEYRLDKDGLLTIRTAKGEDLKFRKAS
jgi:heat shock protein HslJ